MHSKRTTDGLLFLCKTEDAGHQGHTRLETKTGDHEQGQYTHTASAASNYALQCPEVVPRGAL